MGKSVLRITRQFWRERLRIFRYSPTLVHSQRIDVRAIPPLRLLMLARRKFTGTYVTFRKMMKSWMYWEHLRTLVPLKLTGSTTQCLKYKNNWLFKYIRTYRCRRHKKISYVSNYAFFTLLYKWINRGQTHRLEKLQ